MVRITELERRRFKGLAEKNKKYAEEARKLKEEKRKKKSVKTASADFSKAILDRLKFVIGYVVDSFRFVGFLFISRKDLFDEYEKYKFHQLKVEETSSFLNRTDAWLRRNKNKTLKEHDENFGKDAGFTYAGEYKADVVNENPPSSNVK